MFKNVAGQKVAVFAWDTVNLVPKTGNAANITAKVSLDCADPVTSNDVNPTELDATDAAGIYVFDVSQAETNVSFFILYPKSSTTGISILPVFIYPVIQQTGDIYSIVTHADYGNAKLVRSTTPANALDVSATGEAGLDFANIKAASAPTTLTNITVPTVTTLTNLPAVTTNWLTASGVQADAVTKIQAGLATPTNITAGTMTTVTNLTNAPTNGDLTATMKTSVQTAADAALVANKLDHLVAVADADDVADNSIVAKLASKATTANWSDFVPQTDSLEAIRDRGDQAWLTGSAAAADLSYLPTSVTKVVGGTLAGDHTNLAIVNGSYCSLQETTTTTFLELNVNFSGMSLTAHPAAVRVWAYYSGSASHFIRVQAYNYVSAGWEDVGSIPNGTVVAPYAFSLSPNHIDHATGVASIKFIHSLSASGINTHYLYLDKVEFDATSDNSTLATAAELAKVPKSDGAVSFNSTALADIGTGVWANATRTLSSFGSLVSDIATAVWGAVTRTLTAGTNIVLAKGTGITGFNDLDAAAVTAAVPTAAQNGTDAASKILVTPAQKIVTDAAGKVTYSNAAPLDAAGTRSAVGLATANLDTQLAAIPTADENGTDAASKILVTPAQKIVTDASGKVTYSNTAPLDAAGTRSAVGLATANLDTQLSDVTAIKAVTDALTAASAAKLAASAGTMILGTVQAGTLSTTQATTDIALADANQLKGRIIIFRLNSTTAGLRYQATDITAFTVAGGLLTFTEITRAPVAGDTFVIV